MVTSAPVSTTNFQVSNTSATRSDSMEVNRFVNSSFCPINHRLQLRDLRHGLTRFAVHFAKYCHLRRQLPYSAHLPFRFVFVDFELTFLLAPLEPLSATKCYMPTLSYTQQKQTLSLLFTPGLFIQNSHTNLHNYLHKLQITM